MFPHNLETHLKNLTKVAFDRVFVWKVNITSQRNRRRYGIWEVDGWILAGIVVDDYD